MMNLSAKEQAIKAIEIIQTKPDVEGFSTLKSIGTIRNYEQALKGVAKRLSMNCSGSLIDVSVEQAISYLYNRREAAGQKQINMEHDALQCMLKSTGKLQLFERLPSVKSCKVIKYSYGAYTQEQVDYIAEHQTENNAIATLVAGTTGIKPSELLTIKRLSESELSTVDNEVKLHLGLKGVSYTVTSSSGYVREIRINAELAKKLEQKRLSSPRLIVDRGINYNSLYAINGGKCWSNSFSKASKSQLGWSRGANGLRYKYAQERMDYLQRTKLQHRPLTLFTIALEMGNKTCKSTERYLR